MSNLSNKEPEYFTPLHHKIAAQLGFKQTPGYASWDKVEDTAPVQVINRLANLFTTAQQQLLTELIEQKVTGNLNAKALHTYVPVAVIEQKLKELK